MKLKGSAIWRRLTVITFEDIGIGSVDALTMIVAAADDSAWRKNHGGDLKLAVHLAGVLSEAPKHRSADYLCGARDHPALAGFAQAMANTGLKSRLSHVHDQALGLPQQAVAAISATGLGPRGEILRTGHLDAVLTVFREFGVPEELVVATEIAAGRTREPIAVMVPPHRMTATAQASGAWCWHSGGDRLDINKRTIARTIANTPNSPYPHVVLNETAGLRHAEFATQFLVHIPQLCWRLIALAYEWNVLRTAFAQRQTGTLSHMGY